MGVHLLAYIAFPEGCVPRCWEGGRLAYRARRCARASMRMWRLRLGRRFDRARGQLTVLNLVGPKYHNSLKPQA